MVNAACPFVLFVFSTDALMEYTNGEFAVTGVNATANIFASYPAKHLSVVNGFVDQVGLKINLQFASPCKVSCKKQNKTYPHREYIYFYTLSN